MLNTPTQCLPSPISQKRILNVIMVSFEETIPILVSMPLKMQILEALRDDLEVTVHNEEELMNLDPNVTEITVQSNTCNDAKQLRLVGFEHLRKVTIEDNCFRNTDTLLIENCPYLKRVEIGKDCFTYHTNWKEFKSDEERAILRDTSRTFTIRHCNMLKIIVIKSGSFVDYAGGCEISGCSQSGC